MVFSRTTMVLLIQDQQRSWINGLQRSDWKRSWRKECTERCGFEFHESLLNDQTRRQRTRSAFPGSLQLGPINILVDTDNSSLYCKMYLCIMYSEYIFIFQVISLAKICFFYIKFYNLLYIVMGFNMQIIIIIIYIYLNCKLLLFMEKYAFTGISNIIFFFKYFYFLVACG